MINKKIIKMKLHQSIFLLLMAALFICAIPKSKKTFGGTDNKSSKATNGSAAAEMSIGDVHVVRGAKGQTPVDVMIILSQKVESPVTVSYTTKNGTAIAGTDYVATNGSVTFAPGEMVKRISVSIIGKEDGSLKASKSSGRANAFRSYFPFFQAEEDFTITLSSLQGAAQILKSMGLVTIISNFLRNISQGGHNGTAHEVEFTAIGFSSLFGTDPSVCGARTNGHVTLKGILTGEETVDDADDIEYRGVLQLDIDMDICSVMRLSNGEDKECSLSVFGYGPIAVELTISEGARGGYIKFDENYQGPSLPFIGGATGSCDVEQTNEETKMVPYKTIGSVFNGLELPMLTDRTLRVGRYPPSTGDLQVTVSVLW